MNNVFVFELDNCQWPLRERGFAYLFIYFSLQLRASGELKQFITKLTFIALQLRALGNSAVFCWLVPFYKDTLCFCVLFLLCAENSFLYMDVDTLNGQSTGPTNSLMLIRVCLLHHNNTILSHTFCSFSFGVSCRFNGLIHCAGCNFL